MRIVRLCVAAMGRIRDFGCAPIADLVSPDNPAREPCEVFECGDHCAHTSASVQQRGPSRLVMAMGASRVALRSPHRRLSTAPWRRERSKAALDSPEALLTLGAPP